MTGASSQFVCTVAAVSVPVVPTIPILQTSSAACYVTNLPRLQTDFSQYLEALLNARPQYIGTFIPYASIRGCKKQEKLLVAQLLKIISTFYGTRNSITVFTTKQGP
jgi:hypothetical protein